MPVANPDQHASAARRELLQWAAIIAVAMSAAFAVAHGSPDPARQLLFDNLQWSIANFGSAWLVWRAYRLRAWGDDIDHHSRWWFVLGFSSYAVGQLLWDAQELLDWQPIPAPSDLFYAACGPLVAIGLWRSLQQRVSAGRMPTLIVDVLILQTQILTLVLLWYLPGMYGITVPELLQLAIYPVVMLGCVVLVLMLALEHRLRWSWRWLLLPAGLAVTAVAWMEWNVLALTDGLQNGSWLNYSFAVGALLRGMGAAFWATSLSLPTAAQQRSSPLLVIMPVAAVVTAVATVFQVLNAMHLPALLRLAVLCSAAVVIVLAIIRQSAWIAQRDHLLLLERHSAEQEQSYRVLAHRLELASSAAKLGIWELSLPQLRGIWDARMYELFGLPPDSGVDPLQAWYEQVHPDDILRVRSALQTGVSAGQAMHEEYRVIWPDGSLHHLEAFGVTAYDAAGVPVRMTGVTWDVTERVRARRALADSEAELRAIFDNSVIGIALSGIERRVVRYNRAFAELLGQQVAEQTRLQFDDIIHPDDLPDSQRQYAALVAGEIASYQADRRYRVSDGSYHWVRVTLYPVNVQDQALFVLMLEDIQVRKLMQMELDNAQRHQLRMREEFAYRLLTVQEQERQRLANELHDGLGQSLSLIKNRAQLALEHAATGSAINQQLTGIVALTTDAIAEARGLAHNLRPLHIEQLGLTAALERLLEQFQQATRVELRSRLEPMDDAFTPAQVTHVYRLVQEALANVSKHARATLVQVGVERDLHEVRIRIEDNGVGFDAGQENAAGLGLNSMTERAHMLGGTLQVRSAPASGTCICIELPAHYEPATDAGTRFDEHEGRH